ncbi:MAG: hypothetical protein ACLTBV_16775 [Enterocloster bolteae]
MDAPHIGRGRELSPELHSGQVKVESPTPVDPIEIYPDRWNTDEERRIQQETLEKERRAKLLLEDALKKAENDAR